jgi:hypothetical protein
MNYKALALGALVGFAAALTPACSGNEADCGPENCTTCCTAEGQCVAAATELTCGSAGNACVSCGANQICQGGACVGTGVDGGTDAGTGCGPDNCAGCCTTIGGTPTCLPGNTKTNCGSAGVTCSPCAAAESCISANGVFSCTVPSSVRYASQCSAPAECGPLGNDATCKSTADIGGFNYGLPFCARPCDANGTCPDNGFCMPSEYPFDGGTKSPVGLSQDTCFARCNYNNQVTGCEAIGTHLYCVPVGAGGSGACVPYTPAQPGTLGSACVGNTGICEDPPSSGFCYPETTSQGPTGWAGGACMADCSGGNGYACGTRGVCVGVSATVAFCIARCEHPNTKGPDCRPDYTCAPLTSGGQPLAFGACFPGCDAAGNGCDVGELCNTTTGFCEVAPVDGGTEQPDAGTDPDPEQDAGTP